MPRESAQRLDRSGRRRLFGQCGYAAAMWPCGHAAMRPCGHLRLLCPPAIAVYQLAKHLPRFQALYPQVALEFSSPAAWRALRWWCAHRLNTWTAAAASSHTFQLPRTTRAALAMTHIDTMYAAALAGLGIAGLPSYVIEDALLECALERVLPEWRLFEVTLWVGMPSRRFLHARTRAFLDFLLAIFGGEEKAPWLAAAGCATALE